MFHRRRLTIAGLMLLVVLAALLAAWFRPMTPREASRLAVESVHRRGAPAIFGDPSLPPRWRAHEARRTSSGDYTVILVPDEAEGSGHRLKVWVDAETGGVEQTIRGWTNQTPGRLDPAAEGDAGPEVLGLSTPSPIETTPRTAPGVPHWP